MEHLTEQQKSYYYNTTQLSQNLNTRLSNNTYYIFIKEGDEFKQLIKHFLSTCNELINYCLYCLKKKIFTNVDDVRDFILGSRVGNPASSSNWFSLAFTFYEEQIRPITDTSLACYIVDRTTILNRQICGESICFLNPNENLGYSSNYKRNKEKLSNFLLLNNFAQPNQILQGSIQSIVSDLHYLTTLRPLFDYTWERKDYSSNPKDHNPIVIKWLTAEQYQDKDYVEMVVNEYRLKNL